MDGRTDFGAWYRASHPRAISALTVAAGSVDLAEDVTAEAFVRAFERWDRVRLMDSPEGWLYQVALNVLRRRARRRALEHDLLRRSRPPETVPEAIDPGFWQALSTLTDRQRVAVALRYVLDLPEAEVAEVMGVARGTASATLAQARKRLADVLGPYQEGDAPPPGPTPAPRAASARPGPTRPRTLRASALPLSAARSAVEGV